MKLRVLSSLFFAAVISTSACAQDSEGNDDDSLSYECTEEGPECEDDVGVGDGEDGDGDGEAVATDCGVGTVRTSGRCLGITLYA